MATLPPATRVMATLPPATATGPFTRPSSLQPSLSSPTTVCFSVHLPTVGNRRHRFPPPMTATSSASPGGTPVANSEELISSSLESVQVLDLEGKSVPIVGLWRNRKAVVAFARHFGCVLCRKRADLLASKKEVMDVAEVALVLIGPGSVDQAKAFSEQTKFPGEIYADPDHSSYDALNFVYGISTTFTPLAGLKIIQSYMEGYRQDWGLSFERNTVAKGGWQQGGLLVAGPGTSNISFIHKDKEAGDDPDMEAVLKACCL